MKCWYSNMDDSIIEIIWFLATHSQPNQVSNVKYSTVVETQTLPSMTQWRWPRTRIITLWPQNNWMKLERTNNLFSFIVKWFLTWYSDDERSTMLAQYVSKCVSKMVCLKVDCSDHKWIFHLFHLGNHSNTFGSMQICPNCWKNCQQWEIQQTNWTNFFAFSSKKLISISQSAIYTFFILLTSSPYSHSVCINFCVCVIVFSPFFPFFLLL